MTKVQWQRVKEIAADAFEREPPSRAAFVEGACCGDAEVRQEVLHLLAEAEHSEDFLSTAPMNLRSFLNQQFPRTTCFSPGQVVEGRFRVDRFLNCGGMGEVYAAMDLELREAVALKTISPTIASSADAIGRFKREVRESRRITDSCVCRVYDLFSHASSSGESVWFLTMELLEGQTLADSLANHGPMPIGQALPLIRDMVAALSAAHALGIVHRDFKPSNVMLVKKGPQRERAVVTDFGLALNLFGDQSSRGVFRAAGTPAYMSPEQVAGSNVGFQTDQFALGLVICEMLTGGRPALDRVSADESRRQLNEWLKQQPGQKLNADARRAIRRCLEFQPENRFRRARDIVPMLLDLMARAGCNSIFFGVETGSKRMQRKIDKDLEPAQARTVVETADRLGIPNTVSLITGFPEENEDDLCETLDVYLHSLRHARSTPQLNILAPLAGSPIYSQYKDRMVFGELPSQVSYPGRSQSHADRELVLSYPAVFPSFYLLPTPGLDRSSLQELAEFLQMGRNRQRWLLVALYQRRSDILGFFRSWRDHRMALHPDMNGGSLRRYYTLDTSGNELVAFVRERMAEFADVAVEALVTYEETLARAISKTPARPEGSPVSGRIPATGIPVRAPGVHVIELDWDIQSVIDALKRFTPPVAVRTRKYYRTTESASEIRLLEITPLVARSLQLCDGAHTVKEFLVRAGQLFDCTDDLRRYAAGALLRCLRKEGLIEIYRSGPETTGRKIRDRS